MGVVTAYREIVPETRALRSLVVCYWTITPSSGLPASHRVLPDGCIDILLTGDAPRSHARVVGTMTRAIVTGASMTGAIGVRFRPGEAARLLEGAAALTDRDAGLDEVWSRRESAEIDDVLHRGLDAGASHGEPFASIAKRLDLALMRRLTDRAEAVDLRVREAARLLDEGASVRDAAIAVNLSERQLSRRFEARVGITPKTFARVMRLQRASAAIHAGQHAAGAALVAGYVDQAHFTRDAKELAGTTPGGLVAEARAAASTAMSDSYKTGEHEAA